MKIFNYKILYRQQIRYKIDEYIKLTPEQREIFEKDNDFPPFDLLVEKKKVKPVSFLYRLSYIPFMIINCLLIISMPIKYLITGSPYYNERKGLLKKFFNWGEKIHFY